MSFWGFITGNGDAEAAQASNVARQWQTLLEQAAAMPEANYQSYYKTMVGAYGEPPAAVRTALDAARVAANTGAPYEAPDYYDTLYAAAADNYAELYKAAATDGFVEGVKSVPAGIAGGLGSVSGSFLGGLPAWLKWTGAAAAALYAVKLIGRLKK